MSIQKRKKDHVELTVNDQVAYKKKTGFERYDFAHHALPETDSGEIDLTTKFLGRLFSFPVFISSMTGGYSEAGPINAQIAAFCEKRNVPFGVGSQRAMLEHPEEIESFKTVRKHAPTAFIAANIGGVQLIGGLSQKKINLMIESIGADAVIVHLNPLQELMQPEGDRNFRGVKKGIALLAESIDVPVIVKETGAGISIAVAKQLLDIGVKVVDVSGAGGTSWAKVENKRKREDAPLDLFDDWGIPTAECIEEVVKLKDHYSFEIIGSGGIRTSFDIVKALALGADFTAAAQPVIKTLIKENTEGLNRLFDRWEQETRIILTLLGCSSFSDLNHTHLREIR